MIFRTELQQLRNQTASNIKSCCTAKVTITRVKGQPTECERVFASSTSNQGLLSRTYKEFRKLNTRRMDNSINIGK
jgi:hypothetical protein